MTFKGMSTCLRSSVGHKSYCAAVCFGCKETFDDLVSLKATCVQSTPVGLIWQVAASPLQPTFARSIYFTVSRHISSQSASYSCLGIWTLSNIRLLGRTRVRPLPPNGISIGLDR